MDQEVAKTLGELELKLQELERELTAVGRREEPASPTRAPGVLVDEAIAVETPPEPIPGPPIPPPAPTPQPSPSQPSPSQPSPSPSQPSPPPSPPPSPSPSPSPPAAYPPPGLYQSPSPPDPRETAAVEESESVDLAALVRFRDKLRGTMEALIDEYSQMLSAESAPRKPSDT